MVKSLKQLKRELDFLNAEMDSNVHRLNTIEFHLLFNKIENKEKEIILLKNKMYRIIFIVISFIIVAIMADLIIWWVK